MDTETIEQPTATAEAESLEEHKASRLASKEVGAKNGASSPKESKQSGGVENSKTGIDGATAETEATEKPDRPKRDRTAEGRITELTARAKKAEEDREKLRAELEEARKPKAAENKEPAKAAPAEPAKAEDPKPKLADYVKALKPEDTYEDAVERHADALLDWKDKQRAKVEAETRQATTQQEFNRIQGEKFDKASIGKDDYREVMAEISMKGPRPLTQSMLQFITEHPDGFEVAYKLAKDPAEHARIAKLSPALQVGELAYMARGVSGKEPEPKKVPVSRAPAPAEPLKAAVGEAPDKKSTADASSLAEHRRMRTGK